MLVVDDETEVRLVLGEFLTGRGYEVALAESGMDAIAQLEKDRPDVVLLDVSMPEMDGVETLKRIVSLHPTLPVIMVTANADIVVTSKLLALGAADYIPKPFDLEYLDQAVSIQVSASQDQ
ncbi:MAG TPA: response regulator [Candidatus Limnocylindrales bacterium]|nr:response regulator [Candidatus Limnocylindrales bacterium]